MFFFAYVLAFFRTLDDFIGTFFLFPPPQKILKAKLHLSKIVLTKLLQNNILP